MNSRDILPILAQYANLLVPIIVTLVITLVGLAVRSAATTYNANVTDVHVRSIVKSVVAEVEMLLGGNSAAKKQQAVDKLSVLVPWLSRPDASRLVEAAVMDLNEFQKLADAGSRPAPTLAPPPTVPTPGTASTSASRMSWATPVPPMQQSPIPAPLVGGSASVLSDQLTARFPTPPVPASSTAPQAMAPIDTLPEAPLPQG